MSQGKEATKVVGVCWVDLDSFWWNATDERVCPACSPDDDGYAEQHGLYDLTRQEGTMADDDANLTIEAIGGEGGAGMVRVRTDRPGERATSAIVDGRELIAHIEAALGISKETDTEEETPE